MICDLHNIEKFIRDNMPDFDVKYVDSESYIKGYSEQKISSIISSNELQVITYKIKYTDFFNDIGKRYGFDVQIIKILKIISFISSRG